MTSRTRPRGGPRGPWMPARWCPGMTQQATLHQKAKIIEYTSISNESRKNSIQAAALRSRNAPGGRRKLAECSRGGGSCQAGERHFGAVAEEKVKIFQLACLMPWSNLILKDCYLVSFIEA